LTITANNVTQTFNNVPYSGANGVTYSGFVNGQNSSVLGGSIIYGGNSQGAVNVGTYTIVPSGQTSSNYAITYVSGTLTITPPPIAFVLDALGTAANAAGTTAPSTVMNATVLPSPTSLPGNIAFGSNAVLPYGDAGVVGGSASQQTSSTSAGGTSQQTSTASTNQQTSNSANTSQQTSKKRNGNTNQQTSNKRNGNTKQQTNKRNGSTNQQTSNTSDRRTN